MKKFLIALAIIIIVPILVFAALYTMVPSFQSGVVRTMANFPGPIGDYFKAIPSEEEVLKSITEVANYFLENEIEKVVDKLQLAEKHDKRSYDLLIKQMTRLEPNKTQKILAAIREAKLKKSPIAATMEKINEEELKMSKDDAEYISNLSDAKKVEEIKKILDSEVYAHKKIAKILESLSELEINTILSNLSSEDSAEIIKEMDKDKRLDIKKRLAREEERKEDLRNTAALLLVKKLDELVKLIGPSSKYSENELADIYIELGPKVSGRILATISNQEFTDKLVKKIRNAELLKKNEDLFTKDMIKSLNIFRKYDDNINELVRLYKNIEEEKVALMVKTLYWNTDKIKTYPLSNGEKITISDADMAIDLLRSFQSKKQAAILSHLDNRIASDIFTRLALPKLSN